jgi:hypothetical protein
MLRTTLALGIAGVASATTCDLFETGGTPCVVRRTPPSRAHTAFSVAAPLSTCRCRRPSVAAKAEIAHAQRGRCPLPLTRLCCCSAGSAPQAAHSTVRALYKSYAGPLYQVKRKDGKTMDIKVEAAGGMADAAAQDKFCASSTCVFFQIYDQSPMGNHLGVAPPGGAHHQEDIPANAAAGALMVGGKKVYGAPKRPTPICVTQLLPYL